ncbi:DUF6673 family protein [Eubacterium sp.]|uniref:DUF6673 family protein n=1 Tax=Eubacterium sp. TaxID=142586 RepID=UPI0026DF79C3|nr:DUF6673 family protein [Eubacterium sp.]MDO5432967.1 AP endonuclease [Eubacterium sp.]
MLKINGVKLEMDLMDADTAEAVETAIKHFQEKIKKLNKEKTLAEAIRQQCQLVFEFFDEAFGEGAAVEVFGEKTNFDACQNAFKEVVSAIKEKGKVMQANQEAFLSMVDEIPRSEATLKPFKPASEVRYHRE